VSAVETAIKKVKGLSESQAKELLGWLAAHKLRSPLKKRPTQPRRKRKRYPTTPEILAWHASIRRTTDWEPPRMSDEMVPGVSGFFS
jgi:hypothetical protein